MKSGFTLVELILVVSILALLGVVVTPFAGRFTSQNNLEVASNALVSTLRKAQGYAMDGKEDEVWGVCYTSSSVRLFRGSCATPTFSEDYAISSSIAVSGMSDFTFSKLRGEPSSTLSVTLSSDFDSTTVTLNQAGGIDVN